MKASQAIIHNYKSIASNITQFNLRLEDSVTILIGANESGKTNILEALSKFSSAGFTEVEFPSGEDMSDDVAAVSVIYELADNDRQILESISDDPERKSITATRYYSGRLAITDPAEDAP